RIANCGFRIGWRFRSPDCGRDACGPRTCPSLHPHRGLLFVASVSNPQFAIRNPKSVMTASPIIAVFAGGISAEREVSLGSGRAGALALTRSFPTRLFEVNADAIPE